MATPSEAALDAMFPDLIAVVCLNDAHSDVLWAKDRLSGKGARVLARAGSRVGWAGPQGRRVMQLGGLRVFVHRLVWRLHYGTWPNGLVDHIDMDPTNNAVENLRMATEGQNRANTKPRARSGFKGVTKLKLCTSYMAQITVNGKNQYLGSYPTAEQAHAAYCEAARSAFGEFARVG